MYRNYVCKESHHTWTLLHKKFTILKLYDDIHLQTESHHTWTLLHKKFTPKTNKSAQSLHLIDWLMFAYIALFSALLSRLTALACGSTWVTSFTARLNIFFIHRSGVLTAQVLCTPYNHAPCHFMQSYIRKVYARLAVTCHLHFWQNDRDLLRATAVTRGWNRYRN